MSDLNHQEKLKKYNINQRAAFFTIMLAIFVDVLGYSMILPLLPAIAQGQFGASNLVIGVLIASNAFTAFLFAPIWGKLSDLFGRKPMFIIAQLGTLVSFLIMGFSNSLSMIFFSRILDGIFGGQIPIIRAYVVDITDQKTRSSEMARVTAAMAFGMIFGPAIGGLTGVIDWRYPPFIAAALSCVSIVFALRFLVESMPKQRRLDIKNRKDQNRADNIHTIAVLKNKMVLLRLAQIFLVIFAFIIINSSFPLVLGLRYGLNVAMIGIFASIAGVVMLFSGVFTKKLIRKHGERTIMIIALVLMLFTFLSYGFLVEVWMLWIFVFPYTFSSLVIRSIVITNVSKAVEEDQQGEASGWGMNMQAIAQVAAPLIAYWYLELEIVSVGGLMIDAYFMIGITCVFITIALFLLIIFDMKKNPELFLKSEDM